jgi:hypothetical protein
MFAMLRLDPALSRSPGEPLWQLCYRFAVVIVVVAAVVWTFLTVR